MAPTTPLHRLRKLIGLSKAGMLSVGIRKDPYQAFQGVDDDSWFWMFTNGSRRFGILRSALPGMPDANVQSDYVGSSGDHALWEAYRFYRVIKDAVNTYYEPLGPESTVLDFGCGWGRIIRFFLKDVPSASLVGVDVSPTAIEMCQKSFPWCSFVQTPPFPPTELGANSLDLIYLYSVFSHLSETATDAWVSEFHRLLRPGGIVVATTRPRDFILQCEEYRACRINGYEAMGRAFMPANEWLARFDRGEYCYEGTGGGENRDGDFYGEACIPRGYVETHWSGRFRLRNFIQNTEVQLPQNVIVIQKE